MCKLGWSRAAAELRRTCCAVVRVPLLGNSGRASTCQSAGVFHTGSNAEPEKKVEELAERMRRQERGVTAGPTHAEGGTQSGKGVATSETNQVETREACATPEKKFDLLTVRTQALEKSVEAIKEELRLHKEEI
ncbi:hypothetical protein NDU88_005414 [Pleurodeles waltl]|uniref:Uncharacterized protein n=1 Tax=Pleurodeles waltl TaxID=8319 RepID=A0AAV7RIF6_PLEWA|nr:hypothetical protein NDU88_005414 [Pleurodeles waltl]